MNPIYKMQLVNAHLYLTRGHKHQDESPIDIFQITEVLAITFCKVKEDVMNDYLTISQELNKEQ